MYRSIINLSLPIFIGQIAVMANGVIDTVMAGRVSAVDQAAVGIGMSVFFSVFVPLMGVYLQCRQSLRNTTAPATIWLLERTCAKVFG